MTLFRPHGEQSAADTAAVSEFAKSLRNARGRWALRGVATFGALALLVAASSASALVITGGPTYTLPGGGTCSVSGTTGCYRWARR